MVHQKYSCTERPRAVTANIRRLNITYNKNTIFPAGRIKTTHFSLKNSKFVFLAISACRRMNLFTPCNNNLYVPHLLSTKPPSYNEWFWNREFLKISHFCKNKWLNQPNAAYSDNVSYIIRKLLGIPFRKTLWRFFPRDYPHIQIRGFTA